MCGRFVLTSHGNALASLFDAIPTSTTEPRWNIAPTQNITVLRRDAAGKNTLVTLRWGLIPRWVRDISPSSALVNARAESLTEKPSFRDSFRFRRCVIPADGFYEWKPEGSRTRPHFIYCPQSKPILFAGLWDLWQTHDGRTVESCAIITTSANDLLRPLHERMPVILRSEDVTRWLDPKITQPMELLPMLKTFPAGEMDLYPVGSHVNFVRNNDPRCNEPIEPEVQLTLF